MNRAILYIRLLLETVQGLQEPTDENKCISMEARGLVHVDELFKISIPDRRLHIVQQYRSR
jgi:hypothetical protein